jgi:hypothetical protein
MALNVLWRDFGTGATLGVVLLMGTGAAFVVKAAPELRESLQWKPIERACAPFLAAPIKPTRWVRVVGCRVEHLATIDGSGAKNQLRDQSAPAVATYAPVFLRTVDASANSVGESGAVEGMVTAVPEGFELELHRGPKRMETLSAFAMGLLLMTLAFLPFARRFWLLRTGDV